MVEVPPNKKPTKKPWDTIVGEPKEIDRQSGPDEDQSLVEDKPPVNNNKEDLLKAQTAADMEANRGLREVYADKAYKLATGCISIWAVLLGVNGTINALQGREMWSDTVIIAVTTGVTVSVLAAFLGVIRGLFPSSKSRRKK